MLPRTFRSLSPGLRLRDPSLQVAVDLDHGAIVDQALRLRAFRALDAAHAHLPIQRTVRFTARRPLEELFDDLALHGGLAPYRLAGGALLLEADGAFVHASARRRVDYVTGELQLWADTPERLATIRDALLGLIGEDATSTQTFTIDWHFTTAHGLASVAFDELADAMPPDEAYPSLDGGVDRFVARYLAAPDAVLILQGPPGTGKTRLVRAVLAAVSRRKREAAKVFYTADPRALENDEAFVEFLTGSHDVLVVEDADHLLGARANGNADMHRFLAVADGVVRAQGRKIVFTTNLPNVSDVDEALVRPGRCFALVRTRLLDVEESRRLLAHLAGDDDSRIEAALAVAFPPGTRAASLATLFRALDPTA